MTALEAHLAVQVLPGRLGEAEDIARGVLFLGSDDAACIQGTDLVIDGGATGAPVHRAPAQS